MRPSPTLVNIRVPDAAVGVDWSYMVPAALGQCRIAFLSFRLVTSITPATRAVAVSVNDPGGNVKGRAEAVTAQLLSVTRRYTFGQTGTAYQGASGDNEHVPLMECFVNGDDSLSSVVNNLQVGDQLDRIFLWLELYTANITKP